MAQNLTESVKIVKNALEANGVYPDAVSKNKDGHIVVRDTFFYKAGRTSEGHTHKVKKALDAAGIKHSIVDDGEHWAPFRGGASVAKSSHFYTNVKLHEDTEISEGHFKNSESIIFGNRLASRQFHTELRRKHPELETAITDIGGGRHNVSVKALRTSDAFGSVKALSRKHAAIASTLNEESVDEAYPSAAAMSRKAKAEKQARAVARGYENQRSGKWSSQSYKTEDGRWASKDVKEENLTEVSMDLIQRYKKAAAKSTERLLDAGNKVYADTKRKTGRHVDASKAANEAGWKKGMRRAGNVWKLNTEETLVSTKGSDKASRYEMHTNMPGEASEYSSIIKTHQDGKPLQNRWGGYNTLRTGKTAYVKKHFDRLGEETLDESVQARSNAFAFTHTPGDTDSEEKLTKLKKMVKAHNNTTDEHSKLRITARGRLGKDNPNADKYRKGGEVWNAKSRPAGTYDADHNWTPKADGSRKRGEMRDLPMKDAKHHDIYVQPAPRGWDKPGFQERYAKDPYNKISTNHAKSLIAAHKSICEEAGLMEARPDFHYQEWPGQKPKKAFNLSKYVENNAKRQAALKKKAVAEDVEQIDELSKTTLGSYVKKASNDVASKAVEYGTKKAERDEVDRITNRHMKYADKDTVHQALKTTSDDVEAPRVKAAKRIGGIAKAVNKLTNEDVQLDEAPYYSLEASKARMAKEKARATAKAAIAAAKVDSAIARKEARENRSLHIARHIEAEVGNHYPDSDGFEAISNKVRKMGIPHHEVIDHLDKAARKHLGAKSFDHYVDNFHKDAQGSN